MEWRGRETVPSLARAQPGDEGEDARSRSLLEILCHKRFLLSQPATGGGSLGDGGWLGGVSRSDLFHRCIPGHGQRLARGSADRGSLAGWRFLGAKVP